MAANPKNLLDIIAARAPISVAEYMELALAHPTFGYYMQKDPLGKGGDFTTAPEISQIFGELIGLWLAEQWCALGNPDAALVELGPGRGTLMNDLLRATQNIPGFHDSISVHLVETSPTLQHKQWQMLANAHPRISWHKDMSEVPQKPLLLVANEFFDALPVRQFVGSKERMVDIVIPAKAGIHTDQHTRCLAWTPAFAGVTRETCEPAEKIIRAIAEHIKTHNGAALIVDYGYEGGSRGDTLQAVKNHEYHNPLIKPGTADLTCHVDFDLLKKTAESERVKIWGPVPQGIFLTRLGAPLRATKLCERATPTQQAAITSGLERLISLEKMGDLFKVLAMTQDNLLKIDGF
jgi:NADH dehydrogenase [ubiquinone] 1 alpha subcomplex assembly factor 7